MRKKFFIQSIDNINVAEGYAELSLSNFNFKKLKNKKLSKLRWTALINGVLGPGKGTGILEIGDYKFQVIYAWGGRYKPYSKLYSDRTSYSTRIAITTEQTLKDIINQIIFDEHGSFTYEIPFRVFHKRFDSPIAYRKELEDLAKMMMNLKKKYKGDPSWKDVKYLSAEQITKMTSKFAKQWEDPNAVITAHHNMQTIETDMLK